MEDCALSGATWSDLLPSPSTILLHITRLLDFYGSKISILGVCVVLDPTYETHCGR